MVILAIDPGPDESAWVLYDSERQWLNDKGTWPNDKVCGICQRNPTADQVAIEMVACYGMSVGASIFVTAYWVGRFAQAFVSGMGSGVVTLLYRKQKNSDGLESICMHLCKSNRAKDGNIRQALIDRFPATGGGKVPQIGTKKQPGPLYGIKTDLWAALAVAVTFADQVQTVAELAKETP